MPKTLTVRKYSKGLPISTTWCSSVESAGSWISCYDANKKIVALVYFDALNGHTIEIAADTTEVL